MESWADEQGLSPSGMRVYGPQTNGVVDEAGSREECCWVSGTGAFMPLLKIMEELACCCGVIGEYAEGEETVNSD